MDSINITEIKKGSNKSFGLTVGIILIILWIWLFDKKNIFGISILILGALFVAIAFIYPKKLEIINEYWFKLGIFLNKIFQPIIMAILFYLIFTPYGLFLRILGKNYINIKIEKSSKTYWILRDDKKINMKNQF
jgi:hypothetical protein